MFISIRTDKCVLLMLKRFKTTRGAYTCANEEYKFISVGLKGKGCSIKCRPDDARR